ncbi:MAG: cation diffusion facilitator family transporter [Burkholderiaceae bacterium]|nr:cation diffusion facilitator family transporter [Burkholderiaceae bacterium]
MMTSAANERGKAFAIGVALNAAFVALEVFYGLQADSLALLADAGHNLSDVLGLVVAWAGFLVARRVPSDSHTYGWQRGSILAALANAVLLLMAVGGLAWGAIDRLVIPTPIAGVTVIWVAGAGVVVNTATALLFLRGRSEDLNIRGAFLHMAADALVSLGVMVAGVLYLWQGWLWIDPAISLVIGAVILAGTWSLLRQSLHLSLDGVPHTVTLAEVREYLAGLPGVSGVHDLHVWSLGTSEAAMTVHLNVAPELAGEDLLRTVADELRRRFGVGHVTVQLEIGSGACPSGLGEHVPVVVTGDPP